MQIYNWRRQNFNLSQVNLIWTSEAIFVAAFIPLFKVRHLTGHDPTLAKRCMPWRVAIVISTRQRLESDFNKFMLRHCYRSIWMCHASLASQLDAWISSCFFVFVKRAPQHPSVLDTAAIQQGHHFSTHPFFKLSHISFFSSPMLSRAQGKVMWPSQSTATVIVIVVPSFS